MSQFIIRSRRIVAGGKAEPGVVLVEGQKVKKIIPYEDNSLSTRPGMTVHDVGDLVVMPGLVDAHVHINEPGRTEWEGFETGTAAAAAGGVTTIVDMPLNCIPVTTTVKALNAKLAAVDGKLKVDAGFWGGVIPGNASELKGMARAGARGFKAFMCHSGIDDFPKCGQSDLREAMKVIAKLGLPLFLHAELEAPHARRRLPSAGYDGYLASRPASWEEQAIKMAARLCAGTGCRTHIVHLSAASALPAVAEAKRRGLAFSAETCPHYLTFAAEEIQPGSTEFKCAPPIRDRANREKLWQALLDGTLDMIVSDHSPCAPELKKLDAGGFAAAWGGIAGLQFTLPAAWTGLSARGGTLAQCSRLLSEQPARLAAH